MNERDFDVLIVGSGASAVHAAWPLAEAGLRVGMIDPGHRDEEYQSRIPPGDFLSLRRSDPEQWRYFLGEHFEGIPFGPVRVGAQLTPPRQFLVRDSERLAPTRARNFAAMRSFALGGLAAGWGASTMPFAEEDLRGWPIGREELQSHYEAVAARIGICGTNDDDLAPFLGEIHPLLPPARMDGNSRAIYRRYLKRRRELNARGFHAGRPRLAMATVAFRGRGPLRYDDMEFWSDHDRAVYRPRYTVEELGAFAGFRYCGGWFAESFEETAEKTGVVMTCRHVQTGERATYRARRLVLAAGALGTARLVVRSLGLYDKRLPLVSNPYTYFPCVNLGVLGQPMPDRRHSLTQLTMIFDPDGTRENIVQPQLYSYRSLLLFKLLKESPLAHRESIRIMRLLQEYFTIVGVFHPDRPSRRKWLALRKGTEPGEDWLEIEYRPDGAELRRQQDAERAVRQCLRMLGCWAIKTIRPGHGSSIHYAGAFPMRARGGRLTTTAAGQLRAAPLVNLADGATFPHLPAKGLTFTLMANANRVGTLLAKEMKR